MNLESDYCWLKVRRPGFTRLITGSSNGLERTGMRSGILMLLPIEGQKVELAQARLKKVSEIEAGTD